MNPPDIDSIRKCWDAVTPGMWLNDGTYHVRCCGTEIARAFPQYTGTHQAIADATAIAHARTDVPQLCDYAQHLEARVAELETALRGFTPGFDDEAGAPQKAQERAQQPRHEPQ